VAPTSTAASETIDDAKTFCLAAVEGDTPIWNNAHPQVEADKRFLEWRAALPLFVSHSSLCGAV
jgi:hypothetical protein